MLILAKKISRIILDLLKNEEAGKFVESLKKFNELLSQEKTFCLVINSPGVDFNQKKDLISMLLKVSQIDLGEIGFNMLVILVKLNQLSLIDFIVIEMENNLLKKNHITKVKLSAPECYDSKQLEKIEKYLVKKYKLDPKFEVERDDKLIAGFIALFDGKMLNLSMASFFDKLRSIRIE